jgi:ABC-2 type transport system ATP-binding protein
VPVENDQVYRYSAIVAPYLELVEEMTAAEFLQFHSVFKPMVLPADAILVALGLEHASGKQLRNFSSGMKQRIKVAQAIFSNVPVLLLDEPGTNLDKAGYELYHRLIAEYCRDKLVIVSSNDPNEYSFCEGVIDIMRYKQ